MRSFHLTRNPILQDGSTAGIVEEGRAHLEITLVFDAELTHGQAGEAERAVLAERVVSMLAGMRIAGGSVIPNLRQRRQPQLLLVPDADQARRNQFNRLKRLWLPGFALVSRDDLLHSRLTELRQQQPEATALDAWLSLVCLTHRAERDRSPEDHVDAANETAQWQMERPSGWIVPLPVGYTALTHLHPAGSVANTRDPSVPVRFVESVYSLGQWVSPHRLERATQLFWYQAHEQDSTLYRCFNDFTENRAATIV